jgi:peptide/nickel transport system permease protein
MKIKQSVSKKQRRLRIRLAVLLALVGLFLLVGLLAPYLVPNDPTATSAAHMNEAPNSQFPLGTDRYGRCIFSRVLSGTGISVFSAMGLVAILFVVGTALGMACGYFGGILDAVVMRLADCFLSFPQMVLAIAVAGILGGGTGNAMLALGLTGWTLYARMARSSTMALKSEPFIQAARLSGNGTLQILVRHVLPNILGPLVVSAATQIGSVMVGIAGLSFLGIGVTPPTPEWGSMINENRAYMQLAPWAVLAPAAAIVVTVMIFNYLGDTIRDLADVKGT